MVHGNSFYFAVLLPVALILTINIVVLFMVMKSLTKKGKNKITSTQKKTIFMQARIAMACATLLGLTWLFALLAVGSLQYTFQLLFTILNSLQGFFIFFFYTVMNKDVQKKFKNLFHLDDRKKHAANKLPVTTLPRKAIDMYGGE